MRGNLRYGRQNYNRNRFRGNFRNQSYERNRIILHNSRLGIKTEGTIEASATAGMGQIQE